MNDTIRILLVDDHALFRSGIRSLLQCYPEFSIVGEAGDGMEGVKRVVQFQPDVVILDLNMPGLSGCETARMIAREMPTCHVLMLTVSEESEDLFEALKSGACGYLLKNIEAETLVNAIRVAARGESVISPHMLGKLLAGIRGGSAELQSQPQALNKPKSKAELESLTKRESEILRCIARGQSNKEIGRELDITESTVKIHVQNVFRKLDLTSRVQAAVYAIERGLDAPLDNQP